MYAFPPLPLISRVVNKLVSDEATNFVLNLLQHGPV